MNRSILKSLVLLLSLVGAYAGASQSVFTVSASEIAKETCRGDRRNPYRVDVRCRPAQVQKDSRSVGMVLENVTTVYMPEGHCTIKDMSKRCEREEPLVTNYEQLPSECKQLLQDLSNGSYASDSVTITYHGRSTVFGCRD